MSREVTTQKAGPPGLKAQPNERCSDAAPAPEAAKVSYPQDKEWNVAPIKCQLLANSARPAGKGNILALTADQPKEK